VIERQVSILEGKLMQLLDNASRIEPDLNKALSNVAHFSELSSMLTYSKKLSMMVQMNF
jgi:hypothetical protein